MKRMDWPLVILIATLTLTAGNDLCARAAEAPAAATSKTEDLIRQRYLDFRQAQSKAQGFDDLLGFQSKKVVAAYAKAREQAMQKDADKASRQMQAWMLFKAMMPANVQITAVKVNGDSAEISAVASDSGALGGAIDKGLSQMMVGMAGKSARLSPSRTTGTITMVKEDGEWKVDQEVWNTTNKSPEKEAREKAVNSWCEAVTRQPFVQKPAAGKVHGQPFVVQGAEMTSNNIITLRQGSDFFADREITIFVFGAKGALDGQTILLKNGEHEGPLDCHVHLGWKVPGKDLPEHKSYFGSEGIGMKLTFGQRKDGLLPGYILLRMPDAQKSYLEGYFYARLK